MNPILISSARRRMRSIGTPIIYTIYGTILFAFSYALSLERFQHTQIHMYDLSQGIQVYIALVILQFGLILLIAPTMTAGALSGERERQTLDLLLMTTTGSFSLAIGKLLEAFAFVALLILASAPFLSLVLLTGGVTVAQLGLSIAFLLVTAFAALSVGLFASALFRRTATATFMTYLFLFIIGVGTLIPAFLTRNPQISRIIRDPALLDTIGRGEVFTILPHILLVNPGVGLLCILSTNGEWFTRLLSSFTSRGSSFFALIEKIGYVNVALINMAIMFGLSWILIFASSLLVRPSTARRRRKKS